jgi:hypothetical protein
MLATSSSIAALSLGHMNDYINQVMVPRGGAAVFRGPPGMGKTRATLVNVVLQQNLDPDFGGCLFNMANAESLDVRGNPQISALKSQYGIPPWQWAVPEEGLRGAFPALCPEHLRGDPKTWSKSLRNSYATAELQIQTRNLDRYSRGVVVLDECLQTIEESVLLSLAQIFDEHRIGEWGVGKAGWAIVGLTNRIADQAGVRELYAHVRNRIAVFETDHDPDACDDHWRTVGVHPMFRYFARMQPGSVFTDAVPDKQEQFCTPRSFHYAHDDLMAWLVNVDKVPQAELQGYEIPHDHDMMRRMIASRCGTGVAISFSDFLQNMSERPSFKSILNSPRTAKLPTNAVIRAVVEMCVDKSTVDNLDKVIAYIGRAEMPSVMKSIFCQQLARRMTVTTLYQNDSFLKLVDATGPAARQLLFSGQEYRV